MTCAGSRTRWQFRRLINRQNGFSIKRVIDMTLLQPQKVLRPLVSADLDELLRIQREGAVAGLGHIFPQQEHPFPIDTIRARWEAELSDPGVRCFAILQDGRLAGFGALRGNELLHFGTALATWGSGLAGCAHDELMQVLRAEGHRRAWLRVFDENVRAVRFYTRRGWVPTDATEPTTFPPHPTLRRFELDLEVRRSASSERDKGKR